MLEELLKNEEMNPQVQDVFTLKHNGNLYEVGFEELVRLAQKGMDYDRIRKDRDECRQKIKMLESINGMAGEGKALLRDEAGSGADVAINALPEGAEEMVWVNGGKKRAFAELMRRYPEVSRYRHFEALPRGFVEGLESGLSPLEAWQEYLLARQQLKMVMLEREQANRKAAAPNARSNGRYEEDGFVKALFGR